MLIFVVILMRKKKFCHQRASLNADIDRILAQITEILGIDLEEQ